MAVMLGPVERSGRQPDDRPSVQFQPPILCNFTPPLTVACVPSHAPSFHSQSPPATPGESIRPAAERTLQLTKGAIELLRLRRNSYWNALQRSFEC